LAQSYMAQPLITFLDAVCMHQVLAPEISLSSRYHKFQRGKIEFGQTSKCLP
jgi:hypothetical protein